MQVTIKDRIDNDAQDIGANTELKNLIRKITLGVFETGSNETNFHILEMLPTTVDEIMKETNLTKVPVNKHLNELEKYGLLQREKGTGNVNPTPMTAKFKQLIEVLMKEVDNNVAKMLPKLIT
jgi:predicted transcriptional regulator